MKTTLYFGIGTLLSLLVGFFSTEQSISGTVRETNGDPVIFAAISLYKDGIFLTGTETDFDGNYLFSKLDTGTYDVEASYVGFTTQRKTKIVVKEGQAIDLDFLLASGVVLDCVEILEYKVPLIEQDNTTSGGIKTSKQIRDLPTKNINALAATTAGLSSIDGGNVSIRGSRTDATNYYIDGVRVSGKLKNNKSSKSTPAEHKGTVSVPPAQVQAIHDPNDYSSERYGMISDNQFETVTMQPLSTFSIDVDRAAYSNVRRFILSGQRPPKDAVRIEEMINYFDYDYEQPTDVPFSIQTEMHACPWNPDRQLLHIGLQGKSLTTDALPASNLVFLIDVSGSMNQPNKLPLVISSFKTLVENLREQDKIAIVVYAGSSGLVLPPTSGAEKDIIIAALDRLEAGGSTAGAEGIRLAYETARRNFIRNGNNRVILATDGDFNVGVSSDEELVKIIEEERASGIFLTVLGFGTGNYQEHKMQQLADHGNGNHAYIDGISEAMKMFNTEFSGTLFTIAKDVKIQIEFNPEHVESYRLIGYENRLLATEDFEDDAKDAGEIGAGHTVTALYEIVPVKSHKSVREHEGTPLKYQNATSVSGSEEWLNIKFRYKLPDENKSQLIEHVVTDINVKKIASENFNWSAAVAAFGMVLRDSEFKGESSFELVRGLAQESIGEDKHGYRTEFVRLIESMDLVADSENARR